MDETERILESGFEPVSDGDWEFLDAQARDIFRPTAPINEDRLFAGRIPQIEALLDIIYQAGAHAILYGERGVGKTSLANIVKERIVGPAKFTRVLKVGCDPSDVFATIWSKVFFDFAWEGKPVMQILQANPQPFTVFKIAESLPSDKRYLVILDEFDRVQDQTSKTLMADTIKYFSDNPLQFTIVVVGVGNSIAQLFGSHPSIQRCCVQIQMPRMSTKELREIVDERFPLLRLRASDEVIDEMVKFSQGLPAYMHLLGLLCAQAALMEHSREINIKHLENAVRRALHAADESTRQDYHKAIQSTKTDNRYREVLLACAMANKNDLGQFSASDVCEPYSEIMSKTMGIAHFARHLDAFCKQDRGPALIKDGKPKRFLYHFANPLVEPLVIMIGRSFGSAT